MVLLVARTGKNQEAVKVLEGEDYPGSVKLGMLFLAHRESKQDTKPLGGSFF